MRQYFKLLRLKKMVDFLPLNFACLTLIFARGSTAKANFCYYLTALTPSIVILVGLGSPFFPNTLFPRRVKNIWEELRLNLVSIALQAITATTRPWLLGQLKVDGSHVINC